MPKGRSSQGPQGQQKLAPPETNALIRALKLGAGSGTKVILVGKDGEKKVEKTVPPDTLNLSEFFSAIDQMPMAEKKRAALRSPNLSPAQAENAEPAKPAKPGSEPAPQPLDD